MLTIDPKAFAAIWCAAWNTRDIEAVLDHFHEDATFISPFARRLWPDSYNSGTPTDRLRTTASASGSSMMPSQQLVKQQASLS